MNRRFLLVSAFLAVLGAPLLSVAAQDSAGTLGPGDQIRITVWDNPKLSGDFTVAGDGTILHPLYREIQVTGVPLRTVDERIRTFLQRYQTNPQFVVQTLVRVVVGGEVRTPNVLSVPPETTVAQAIALAGGPTDRADLNNVRVIRNRQEMRMDLTRADSDAVLIQIRSGDQILVGRTPPSRLAYIAPVASTIAALAAILSIVLK